MDQGQTARRAPAEIRVDRWRSFSKPSITMSACVKPSQSLSTATMICVSGVVFVLHAVHVLAARHAQNASSARFTASNLTSALTG